MRIFLIVLDSVGIGNAPDAESYGDKGSNTLKTCYDTGNLYVPNLKKVGLFNIDGNNYAQPEQYPIGAYGRLSEKSKGKDTTTGHWEICGIISERPMPTYPNGFPDEVIREFEDKTGKKVLCNKPYSGTDVIRDYGREHMETGALIVYTSADSVFQIAAHEDVVPVDELYKYCEIAREMLVGEHGVGRVIARPFIGEYPNFTRTSRRHDFSIEPPENTLLDDLKKAGKDVIGVGKIYDIFAGRGLTEFVRTTSNSDGMDKTIEYAQKDFDGLCFVNLVDFDMLYGHRNNINGYTQALNEFDVRLGELMGILKESDMIMITADHGCDPGYPGTDHTRECVPWLIYGGNTKKGENLHTIEGFDNIAQEIRKIMLK